ncbi:hypothetical protein PFISCL1PPCAC_25166, partial [Pristionchus fissidentatus]
INQADFSAYCAVEISKTCKNNLNCSTTQNCPTFTAGTATHNAKLECKDGKWLINKEYFVGIQAICKEDETKP